MMRYIKSMTGHLVLAIFAILALIPLLLVLINSFKSNAETLKNPFRLPSSLSFDNFVTAWTYGKFSHGFINSIILTGATVIVVLVFSSLAGYVLAGQKIKRWPVLIGFFSMALTPPLFFFFFFFFFLS